MSVGAESDLPDREVLRNLERDAVMALAVDSLGNRGVIREQLEEHHTHHLPSVREALDYLTKATDAGRRISQRTLVLSLLVKFAGRRGHDELRGEAGSALDLFLQATVDEANRPPGPTGNDGPLFDLLGLTVRADVSSPSAPTQNGDGDPGDGRAPDDGRPQEVDPGRPMPVPPVAPAAAPPAPPAPTTSVASMASTASTSTPDADPVENLNTALKLSASEGANAGAGGWAAFASHASDLNLSMGEVGLPQCSDEQQVVVASGQTGTRTLVSFTTDRPASDFAAWTDPRQWHLDCSLFFKSLTPKTAIPHEALEFSGIEFEEVVAIDGDPANDMVTPLLFSRRVNAPGLWSCRYILPPGVTTAKLDVDEGMLRAREDPNETNPKHRTTLTAEKIIRFVDPALLDWPTHLCDLWWLELTITVALGCAQDGH